MASGIPTNRTNIELPNDVAAEILQKTQEGSAVMQLARQIALPGRGTQIPVIAGDPTASWVAETGAKPVSNPSISKKVMQAHKLAVIVPFSNEFARDARALYDALVARLPGVLAKTFDSTVFFGPSSGSLANFDNFANCTAQNIGTSAYGGLVAADGDIAEAGGVMNGIVLSPQGKSVLLSAVDGQYRPLFNTVAESGINRVLGADVYVTAAAYKEGAGSGTSQRPDFIGVAGDWSHAMYGTVEGVRIDYSSDATLTLADTSTVNLFQNNMFAVRAEIEVGFVAETDYFDLLVKNHAGE